MVESSSSSTTEGENLLGSPTFTELDNGRFKCVETGHECQAKEIESYGKSKRCRLGLIDFALSMNKPPLNLFKQDPLSRSKLICTLTGDTVNKSEEHIWKHLNGRQFLNKLEQKEAEKLASSGKKAVKDDVIAMEESTSNDGNGVMDKKKVKKQKVKEISDIISEVRESSNSDSDAEDIDFWVPPPGKRWDFDDGGDRWGSGLESEQESDGDILDEEDATDQSVELSNWTKRMSIEIGPSSFASRKKKSKIDSSS